MKIGSLCSGYGGLDMAVEAFYEAETVWMSDVDKASSLVIDKRWGLPNLGDLKLVDWENIKPVDILTAGYPCQPFSTAGQRKGSNDPRHLWPSIKEIISRIRPGIVVLENVRGHLTLGFKEVLKDLTEIGYDARWEIVRASDVGAPHRRERLFILAQPTNSNSFGCNVRKCEEKWDKRESQSQSSQCSQITTDTDSQTQFQSRRTNRPVYESTGKVIDGSNRNEHRCRGETISNPNSEQLQTDGQTQGLGWRFKTPSQLSMLRTPNPLDQSKLNAKFVEYMMGLPEGWVTDLDLSRAQMFKLLGNGVVPQQAYRALEILNTI